MRIHDRPLCFTCVLSRTPSSEVSERNSTKVCHIIKGEPYFKIHVQNLDLAASLCDVRTPGKSASTSAFIRRDVSELFCQRNVLSANWFVSETFRKPPIAAVISEQHKHGKNRRRELEQYPHCTVLPFGVKDCVVRIFIHQVNMVDSKQ